MIEKLSIVRMGHDDDALPSSVEVAEKINELIEASNRQDRAIALLLVHSSLYHSVIIAAIGEEAEIFYREIARGKR